MEAFWARIRGGYMPGGEFLDLLKKLRCGGGLSELERSVSAPAGGEGVLSELERSLKSLKNIRF